MTIDTPKVKISTDLPKKRKKINKKIIYVAPPNQKDLIGVPAKLKNSKEALLTGRSTDAGGYISEKEKKEFIKKVRK